ncbi:hypothetical protein [uncultured Alistipes sp.]|uniref:hypothetical protein n=1 Tax=uncultured Alistipes sp. TaxID=538949 RepID=UPI00272D382A|nr:hypothetical protein [uncultured Alistipes sp.]
MKKEEFRRLPERMLRKQRHRFPIVYPCKKHHPHTSLQGAQRRSTKHSEAEFFQVARLGAGAQSANRATKNPHNLQRFDTSFLAGRHREASQMAWRS